MLEARSVMCPECGGEATARTAAYGASVYRSLVCARCGAGDRGFEAGPGACLACHGPVVADLAWCADHVPVRGPGEAPAGIPDT